MKAILKISAFVAVFFASSAAWAACTTDVRKDDLTDEQVQSLYDCVKSELRDGYASRGEPLTKEYQGWRAATKLPGISRVHGKRFLMIFANNVAFDEYVKFSQYRGAMPVGSILAMESFNVTKRGKVKRGPLFLMTKVETGGEQATFGNWLYMAFRPSGKTMKVKQSLCHRCHGNFVEQDSLGYPWEENRVSTN